MTGCVATGVISTKLLVLDRRELWLVVTFQKVLLVCSVCIRRQIGRILPRGAFIMVLRQTLFGLPLVLVRTFLPLARNIGPYRRFGFAHDPLVADLRRASRYCRAHSILHGSQLVAC